MSVFKELWTKIARFAEALDGADDPMGDYILSLGKRIKQLESEVAQLKSRPHPHTAGGLPD